MKNVFSGVLIKRALVSGSLLLNSVVFASPAVGVFAAIPSAPASSPKLSGMEKLIFTAEKLSTPATFSYFQNRGSHYMVACCVEVKDITPVTAEDLIKKYPGSEDFAAAVKSIKGYKFIYRAVYSTQHATYLLKTDASADKEGGMLRLYPAAEVVIDKDDAKTPFAAGTSSIALKSSGSSGKAPREIYTFTVDGKKSVFSFPEANPE